MPAYDDDEINIVPNPCTPEQSDRNDNACRQMFELIQPDITGIAPIAEDANAYSGGPQQYADDILSSLSSGGGMFGLAHATGISLPGADFTSSDLWESGFAGMSSCLATVFQQQDVLTAHKWNNGALTNQTVCNPTPWAIGSVLNAFVKKVGSLWVIERDRLGQPYVEFINGGLSLTGSLQALALSQAAGYGGMATTTNANNSFKDVLITAPVPLTTWLFEVEATVDCTVVGPGSAEITYTLTEKGSGTNFISDSVADGWGAAGDGRTRFRIANSVTIQVVPGEEYNVQFRNSGSGTASLINARLLIRPLTLF